MAKGTTKAPINQHKAMAQGGNPNGGGGGACEPSVALAKGGKVKKAKGKK